MKNFMSFCKKGISFILCGILLFAVVGCGKEEGPESVSVPTSASNPSGGHEGGETAPPDTKWKTEGFSYKDNFELSDSPEEMATYHMIRLSSLEDPEPEFDYSEQMSVVDFLGNTRYTLSSYKLAKGQRFVLEKAKSDVGRPKRLELFDGADEVPVGYAACMDVVTESEIAVLFACTEGGWKGKVQEYLLLRLDAEGNILSWTKLLDSYRAEGIEANDLSQDRWHCDGQGNSYVLANSQKTLAIFDAEGGLIMRQDYTGEEQTAIEPAFHAPDGSVIFPLSDPGQLSTKLLWMDLEKKQWKELASIGTPNLRQFTMLENGQVYFSRGSSLIKWDVETGAQERILNYMAFDISNNMFEYVKHVSLTEQGELILYVAREGRTDVCVLSDKEQGAEGFKVVDTCMGSIVQSWAAGYGREHGISIGYKSPGDMDAFWIRTMAEFAAGKGPDMMCLWPYDEHIRILHDKGVLADLEELVPEDVLAPVFPGILESGRVDGELVGLGIYGMPAVVVTSDKLWQQDTWTTEDIVGIIEAHPDLEGIYISDSMKMSPGVNLDVMCLAHMESCPFVSYEKGESYFGDTAFQRIMELAKIYGEMPAPLGEKSEIIKEGRCIATFESVGHVGDFMRIMEEYGEGCRFMGLPGQSGYSGYWFSAPLVVVNKNSAYLDEIAGFLQYILAFENQTKAEGYFYTTVSEDVVRQHVDWDSLEERWAYKGNGWRPFTKPNGDSYVEEYVEFLKKLGPPYTLDNVVADIVLEEAEDYFNGIRSAAQAAEIIDNRVQLYLDE